MKSVLKSPFKNLELNSIQANMKEGEDTNHKIQHSKESPLCSKTTVAFQYLFVHKIPDYSYDPFALDFSN
jgi:hypothetical protein